MGSREPVDMVNANAEAAADTLVEMDSGKGFNITKIPTRGHTFWSLTSEKSDAGAGNCTLKGTNNPDPADATGETLITNAHAGAGQLDADAADIGYKYVFVGVDAGNFNAGKIRLHGTGFA